MADCSAAGTTIDRAARALLGGNGSAAVSKPMGALLGHVSNAGALTSMLLASPDHIVMPGQQNPEVMRRSSQNFTIAPTRAFVQQPPTMPMRHHPQEQHIFQQQQQQQQQLQLQFQQQQVAMTMMMQQQQQIQQQQIQQQRLETSKAETTTTQVQKAQGSIEADWHEGLEDDFLQHQETLGTEFGEDAVRAITGGAGIEELAEAWAEAEAEYDSVLLDHENANLWSGGTVPLTEELEQRPYEFTNPLADESNNLTKNYMEEGMIHFQEGNIKEAIRSFEMELQTQNMDNAKAWRMLGKCHAENDQDPEAIQCLEAAVDRDPFCPEALLALGVSYVNELNHERALENMKAWFTHNPKYAGLELPVSNQDASVDIYGATSHEEDVLASHRTAKESAFEEVKTMLLAALDHDPTDAGDVYEALGVIYNVIKDYDAAVESFQKALESRPDDYQLWNKLGATLANGSQSDRALPMYHQSLKVKPKYARAWLNMAISHSNLMDHDEAARCYLQTLSLNPQATHCWTYLRMALSSKERWDLLPLVFERNLAGFQEHFDFVLY